MKPFAVTLLLILAACGSDKEPPVIVTTNNANNTNNGNNGNNFVNNVNNENNNVGDMGTDVSEETPPGYGDLLYEGSVEITNSVSPLVRFDVPDDAVSVHISVFGEAGETYGLGEWTNGDGSILVNPNWVQTDVGRPSLCVGCPNRVTSSEGAFGALAPNNQDVALIPGEHTISIIGFEQLGFNFNPLTGRTVDIRIVAKRLDSEPENGTLDLNFYFTGVLWDAESAQEEGGSFQQLLDRVADVYAPVGITLGNITYTDIGEEYEIVANVLGPRSEVQDLWKLTADAPQAAVNVFLVKEIYGLAGPGFGVILGLSGGIPGPNVIGTERSGVVVAIDSDMAPPGTLNHTVIAHEVGHHLGLWHSSESMANIHDQLDDTAQNDAANLMFHSGTGAGLSPNQGRVMRLNPWVDSGERP